MALINIKDAALGYDGKVIVQNINLSISAGDYLYIVGENGSGKSTLMKTILGLLTPMKGEITFGDGLKQNKIGYLPQQTDVQKDFPASVNEIVLSGCLSRCGLRPFYNQHEKGIAQMNMERMGIAHLAKRCYRELSGGQQQRVLLARALCATQDILLLDEPVAGLDPQATEDMYHIIDLLNKDNGIAVVMISHDIAAAMRYATHVLHLGHAPLFYGSKEEYASANINTLNVLKGGDVQ